MKNDILKDEILVDNNPMLYYMLTDIVRSITPDQAIQVNELKRECFEVVQQMRAKSSELTAASDAFMDEVKMAMRVQSNPFSSLDKMSDMMDDYANKTHNYVVLSAKVVEAMSGLYDNLYQTVKGMNPPVILSTTARINDPKDFGQLQHIYAEIQLNGKSLERYANGLAGLYAHKNHASKVGGSFIKIFEGYYKMLLKRHSTDGNKIHVNTVVTDVAMQIFDNIDSHGEIESGKDKNQVSAYTISKAQDLARALKNEVMMRFVNEPTMLIEFVIETLDNYQNILDKLNVIFAEQIEKVKGEFFISTEGGNLGRVRSHLRELDPTKVVYVQSNIVKNESEQMMEDFRNDSIERVAELIVDEGADFGQLVDYILERKAELRKFFHEENSFYVCKIGDGNSFLGQAPGALYVTPAEKPKGDLDNIRGSGFEEVKDFAESIKSSAKFHDLFVATSPSGTADKSNVLLVGPQGCGKTEVMRAIGAQKDSLGIFAQGSDFLTCWRGEAEKNPKRLFEEGIRLNRESGKHVHFLIDEIDAVLNNDRGHNDVNLTLEFQILMDGVVRYPNLSVWGATNHLERIPVPMIRRFSKVLIVGELSQADRVALLKHFMSTMPMGTFKESQWGYWADRLNGATGDVIRKVADYLWREKMNWFVNHMPQDAQKAMEIIVNAGGADKMKGDAKKELHQVLTPVKLASQDISTAIEVCLTNVAIATEIKTAVLTYERAHEFMKAVRNEHDEKPAAKSTTTIVN